jgi:hypothetical protein
MTNACAQVKPLTTELVAYVLDHFGFGRNRCPPMLRFPAVLEMETDRATPGAGAFH